MRKIIFSLALLLTGGIGYAQTRNVQNTDVGKHKEYVMKTYGVDAEKADAYEEILTSLNQENDGLKSRKMTSQQFRTEQSKLYKRYGTIINQTFYGGKYRTWSYCTQDGERYQMLSDNRLIPYNKMRTLYEMEREQFKEHNALWKGTDEESVKYEKENEMNRKHKERIVQLLGEEDADWYFTYRALETRTFINMDRYGISYKDAMDIAGFEEEHKRMREKAYRSGKPYGEIEIDLLNLEEKLEQNVTKTLPNIQTRWNAINHAKLDYDMKSRFGLNSVQIKEFKTAYGKYAIEEYRIMGQAGISGSEKYSRLSRLSEEFCKKVEPLFQPDNYKKWFGWWDYKIQLKMKGKGLK